MKIQSKYDFEAPSKVAKALTLLALFGWSASSQAVSITPLSIMMNVESCPARCEQTITATGTPGNFMAVTLNSYLQEPSGSRSFAPLPLTDERYRFFTLKGVEFGKPIAIPASGELKITVVGQKGLRKLRGGKAALSLAVSQVSAPPKPQDDKEATKVSSSMTIAVTFMIRVNFDGLSSSGVIKFAHLGTETLSETFFEKLSITNTTARPVTLKLDGRTKGADGKVNKTQKLPVLFQTMISDYLQGKPINPLTVGPGGMVYIYVPVKDLKGSKLKVLGQVQGGHRLGSKEFIIGEQEAPVEPTSTVTHDAKPAAQPAPAAPAPQPAPAAPAAEKKLWDWLFKTSPEKKAPSPKDGRISRPPGRFYG